MVWNTVLLPLKVALALGSGVILVRVLSKADYSIYNLVLGTAALIGTWVDLGTERSVARFTPEIENRTGRRGLERFFTIIFGVKLLILAPVVVAFAVAPDWFTHALALDKTGSGTFLLWAIVGLLILGMVADVFVQFLYTHFRQLATNLLDLIGAVIQPLIVIALALAGAGIVGLVIAMLMSSLLLDLLTGWQARRSLQTIPERAGAPPPNLWSRFTGVAALNFLMTATTSLTDPNFANLVLTGTRQLTDVAIMVVGYRYVIYFLRYLTAPLNGIQTPLFARLHTEQRTDALRESYATLTKFFIFTLVPSGAAMILLAPRLIPFLFTETYAESVPVAALLVVFLFGETITSIPLSMLIVFEQSRAVIISRLVALLVVPLLALLVPPFGAVGAALALGAPRLFSRVVATAYTVRAAQIRFPFAFLLRVSAASALSALPLFFTRNAEWWWMVLALVLFAVLFMALFKLLGGFDAQEKDRLKTLKLPFKEFILRWL
jgi:O-antigen/teichoic acid export membrane protein